MKVYMVLAGDAYDNAVIGIHATPEGAAAQEAIVGPEFSWVEEWEVQA
jgi:hypothetical protein